MTDGNAGDNFFDTTETITGGNDGFGATDDDGTFIGTIDVLGVTWTGIQANSGRIIFYATVTPGTTNIDINNAFFSAAGNTTQFSNLTLTNTGGFTTCFAAGTLIATPRGEQTVETLAIGDTILTADGRAVPVKWIGRQTLLKVFAGERARPVRIAAGALGGGLPHADLVLTSDHALIMDGLIPLT
ncbi:Hint domain-containing protein [Aestuariivirga sp.]|uniref:Hint domain-containing protein n=1 Tax=Aestuariivirga sp. TaxID=2650926 RepID=UPI003593082A